jgi:ligand-binding SRPBCC domain-containing protein
VPEFIKSNIFNVPVATLFAFHEREDALQLLTPPFPPVRIISKSAPGLVIGTRIELQVGFFHWVAIHTAYQQNVLFIDEQAQGPFARWIHRHEFEDLGGTRSRLTDRIDFTLPGGSAINFCFGWMVLLGLGRVFKYRHQVTRALTCINEPQ